jgi:hypothetical protein
MFEERAVIGAAWIGAAGALELLWVEPAAELGPAAAPPVVAAKAGVAGMATIVRLQKNALRVLTRKTPTSFVGLRG